MAYRLKDDDVVVVNGVIVNCIYDISTKGNVIEIPDVLDNQTITGIGDRAFSVAGKIAVLTLPTTLKTIGYGVFEGHALTSLVIPDGVTSIGGRAFYGNALANINLPAGLQTIAEETFANNQLTSITLPAGLKNIGWGAFQNNKITSLIIPKSVLSINVQAFFGNRISDLTFESGSQLKEITDNCFSMNDIKTLTLPNSILSIGSSAFFNNPNLKNVTFGNNLLKIKRFAFANCNISSLNLPGSLVFIGRFAFNGNFNLNSFKLPVSAKNYQWVDSNGDKHSGGTQVSITSYSYVAIIPYTLTNEDVVVSNGIITSCSYFDDILHLGSVITIPEKLDGQDITGIGRGVFNDKGISGIILPKGLKVIDDQAFAVNEIIDLVIPSGLNEIGAEAFYWNCINSLIFEPTSQLTTIGMNSFSSNRITSIDFPQSVVKIEKFAFQTNFIQNIKFENNSKLLSIGSNAFIGNNLSSITLPDPKANSYDYWVDWNNKQYSTNRVVTDFESFYKIPIEYTLSDADVVVENGLIISCSPKNPNANILTIPETLNGQKIIGIGNSVFRSMGLIGVNLPPSLQTIFYGAFGDNDILKVTIPANVTKIEGEAFFRNNINELNFEPNSKLNRVEWGAFYLNRITLLTLPESLTYIESYAFGNNRIANGIKIPDGVEYIGWGAFGNNQIPQVIFGDSSKLSYLGNYAFSNNQISNDINIPKQLTEISDYAFLSNKIRKVIVHDGIVDYGNGAFQDNDPSLKIVLHKPPTIPFVTHFFGWKDSKGIYHYPGETVTDFSIRYKAVIDQFFVVKFIVKDDNNNPVEDATIQFYNDVLLTDKNGIDSIGPVMRGLQNYNVSASGCYGVKGNVDVQDNLTVTITMTRFYKLTIKIVDTNSNPIPGAAVNINGNNLVSDSKGIVTLSLPDGNYPFKVTSVGYNEEASSAVVLDADYSVSVKLIRISVNYFPNKGTGVAYSDITFGNSYTTDNNSFTRQAYTFLHWNTTENDTGIKYAENATINLAYSDIDLFAIWKPVSYKIIYHLDGGTNAAGNPSVYNFESEFNLLPADKPSLYFSTWLDADSNRITRIDKGFSGDIELWAVFTPEPTYFVDYHNVENATHRNQSIFTKFDLPLSFTEAYKRGYSFEGWFEDALFGKKITSIPDGSKKNYDIYAKWGRALEYKILYQLNGGINSSSNPAIYTIESSTITFGSPSKTGANFIAWYSDNQLTRKITGIPTGSVGDTTIYAKWELDTFDIQYVMNGGDNHSLNPGRYTIDSDVIKFKNPAKPGANFMGWYAENEFINKITEIPHGSVGDKAIYAKWKLSVYKIDYVLSGGINSPSNPANYTIESSTITFGTPSKTGANFIAWYSDNQLTGKITDIPAGSFGDTTIYAKWELDTFDIFYVMNGGINHPLNPAKYTIESENIILQKPEKEGYFFAGWYPDSDYSDEINFLEKGNTGDKTFYAKWIKIFALNFFITTDSVNPAKDIEIVINNSQKLTTDSSGMANDLLPDGSNVEYSIQMNGIEIEKGYVNVSGRDYTVEIVIVDCYLRWWDVLFCDNGKGLWTGFEWYNERGMISEEQFFHNPGGIKTGDYKLMVTAINGNKYIWEKGFGTDAPWKKLKEPGNSYLSLFPNPVRREGKVNIGLSEAVNLKTSVIYIYNVYGGLVKTIDKPLYMNSITFGDSFSSGQYHVILRDETNNIYESKGLVVY